MSLDVIPELARHVPVIRSTDVPVVGVRVGGLARYRHQAKGKAMGTAVPERRSQSHYPDSKGVKLVADRLSKDARIHGMMHRTSVVPVIECDHNAGFIVEPKAGRMAIMAKVAIGSARDTDVAVRFGAAAPKTPSEHRQAASVMFHLAGLNKARFMAKVKAAPQTRKIAAVYDMTKADMRHQGRFKDNIDRYGILLIPTTGRCMHIPYRSMLPKGVKGMPVASRAIGGDRVAHAATRNMAFSMVAGQGAGVAAAQAAKSNCNVDSVDIDAVQQELIRQGVRIQ